MTLAERRGQRAKWLEIIKVLSFDVFYFFYLCFFNWEDDGHVDVSWQVSWELFLKDVENTVCHLMNNCGKISTSSSRLRGALHVFVSSRIWKHGDLERQGRNHWQVMKCPKVMSSRVHVETPWKKVKLFYSNFERVFYTLTSRITIETIEFVGCSKKVEPLPFTWIHPKTHQNYHLWKESSWNTTPQILS